MLKFHFDECVKHHPALAATLIRDGIDVTIPASYGLRTAGDEQHRTIAIREKRVIITCDPDFLAMHFQGSQHAGIAYFEQNTRAERDIMAHVRLMHHCLNESEILMCLEFIPLAESVQ